MKIRAFRQQWRGKGISIFIEEQFDKRLYLAKPIELAEYKGNVFAELDPTLEIMDHDAQQLMDDLWAAGLRPSEGTGSAGQLASVQKHLADMRAITFAKLKIVKP